MSPALYNLFVGIIGAMALLPIIGIATMLSFRFVLGDPKRGSAPREGEIAIEFAARWRF